MPLTPSIARELIHTCSIIIIHGYLRADGLYDIEGHLTDAKTRDMTLTVGVRKAGEPIHEMWLRITIDKRLNIVAAEAQSDAMPYPGHCDKITPKYQQLVGLSLLPGFTAKVRDIFGGVEGCTHITELIGKVATTAYQTLAGEVKLSGGHETVSARQMPCAGYRWPRCGEVLSPLAPRRENTGWLSGCLRADVLNNRESHEHPRIPG